MSAAIATAKCVFRAQHAIKDVKTEIARLEEELRTATANQPVALDHFARLMPSVRVVQLRQKLARAQGRLIQARAQLREALE